jgi:hypothetical protein
MKKTRTRVDILRWLILAVIIVGLCCCQFLLDLLLTPDPNFSIGVSNDTTFGDIDVEIEGKEKTIPETSSKTWSLKSRSTYEMVTLRYKPSYASSTSWIAWGFFAGPLPQTAKEPEPHYHVSIEDSGPYEVPDPPW